MFLLTKEQDNIQSGAYATLTDDGKAMVQFFESKDDAVRYCIQLEALGQDLHVTPTKDWDIDKLCNVFGHAYCVVKPGEIVVPRAERMQLEMLESINELLDEGKEDS